MSVKTDYNSQASLFFSPNQWPAQAPAQTTSLRLQHFHIQSTSIRATVCNQSRVYLNYKIGSRYLATSIPTSTIQSNLSNSTCYVTTRKSGQQYAHTIKPLLRSDGTPCYVSIHHGKIVVKIAKTIVHRAPTILTLLI